MHTNKELLEQILPCVISADSDSPEEREILDAAQRAAAALYHRAEAAQEMVKALIRAKDHLIMSEGHFLVDGRVGQSGDWEEALSQLRQALKNLKGE